MAFASGIAAGVAPLGQRVRGVFRLPPSLPLDTPLPATRKGLLAPFQSPKEVGSTRKY